MNNIRGIQGYSGPNAIGSQGPRASQTPQQAKETTLQGDQVEISSVGRYLSQIASMPEIRSEKVEQIREALASGNYELDSKLPEAIDKFIEENFGE